MTDAEMFLLDYYEQSVPPGLLVAPDPPPVQRRARRTKAVRTAEESDAG